MKIPFCFAGLPNPASTEAISFFLGLDLAIQASDKQISKRFLTTYTTFEVPDKGYAEFMADIAGHSFEEQ